MSSKKGSEYFESTSRRIMVEVSKSRNIGVEESKLAYIVLAELFEAYHTGFDDAMKESRGVE